MSKDTGGPAFPVNTTNSANAGACFAAEGMTLRDYFAAQAMNGLLSQSTGHGLFVETRLLAAEYAYAMADAMLAARGEHHE